MDFTVILNVPATNGTAAKTEIIDIDYNLNDENTYDTKINTKDPKVITDIIKTAQKLALRSMKGKDRKGLKLVDMIPVALFKGKPKNLAASLLVEEQAAA